MKAQRSRMAEGVARTRRVDQLNQISAGLVAHSDGYRLSSREFERIPILAIYFQGLLEKIEYSEAVLRIAASHL